MICPKCNAEIHEKQPFCYHCGYSEKYLKSHSPLANYINSQILKFKILGFKTTLIYLIGSPINIVVNKIPWLIKNNIEFRRLKERGSIGWRMGYCESYLMKWDRWYNKLSNDDKSQYQNMFPPPEDWKGFYSSRRK